MAKRVIVTGLSESSLDKAIAKLEQYKQNIEYRTDLLRVRVAQRVEELSQTGFNNAMVDDIISNGSAHKADVKVYKDDRENLTVVIAHGKDAIWVEFGSGVFHNGSVGSSPNPNGVKMGYTIGSYGKGRGKQDVWYYSSKENDEPVRTHGTEATMPMYHAMRQIETEIYQIAREVFR